MTNNPNLPDDPRRSEGKRDVPLQYVLAFMEDGDILKLKKNLRVGEFSWMDGAGVVWDQSELTAAQLLLARKFKLVLPKAAAILVLGLPEEDWSRAIRKAMRRYYVHYKCGEDLPLILKPDVKT